MIKLEPFDLKETAQLLDKGRREAILAAMAVGGCPEYLKQVKAGPSVYVSLLQKSFRRGGFFLEESKRIFVSSLANNRFYEGIIRHLAINGPSSRSDLYQALSRDHGRSAGGSFSEVLEELVQLDLIDRVLPVTKAGKIRNASRSRFARYILGDEYLRFYYTFIVPRESGIGLGRYDQNPVAAVDPDDWSQAMGYSFERWCRRNVRLIARHMRFDGVVEYTHGPWYEPNVAQIDLMFIRRDFKIIICEIKYNSETELQRKVILETQTKIDHFKEHNPRYAGHTFERALITIEPVPDALKNEAYYTYLITSHDLLSAAGA